MPDLNQQVLAMVRSEVQKRPDVSNKELIENAVRIDPSIRKLQPLQFHGSYRLPIARELAAARGGGKARAGGRRRRVGQTAGSAAPAAAAGRARTDGGAAREEIRRILLQFAHALTTGSNADVIAMIAALDKYVDRVIAATR
jgi:hypothetical protein